MCSKKVQTTHHHILGALQQRLEALAHAAAPPGGPRRALGVRLILALHVLELAPQPHAGRPRDALADLVGALGRVEQVLDVLHALPLLVLGVRPRPGPNQGSGRSHEGQAAVVPEHLERRRRPRRHVSLGPRRPFVAHHAAGDGVAGHGNAHHAHLQQDVVVVQVRCLVDELLLPLQRLLLGVLGEDLLQLRGQLRHLVLHSFEAVLELRQLAVVVGRVRDGDVQDLVVLAARQHVVVLLRVLLGRLE
jgi:hypothetical protein